MPNLYIFKSMPANLNKTPHADLFRAGDCILSTDTAGKSAHTVNLITVKTTKDGNLFFDYVGHLEDTRPFKTNLPKNLLAKN